jgi:endoglucanase
LLAGSLAALPQFAAAQTGPALNPADRTLFRSRFVAADGRVVDNGNGGISHSEGQDWGMLFAVAFNDRATFESIQAWTARTLRRPGDALHAWRYQPNSKPPVDDTNDATDGDLFIAAAQARAGHRWGVAQHLQAAAAIARDILKLLVRQVARAHCCCPAPTASTASRRLFSTRHIMYCRCWRRSRSSCRRRNGNRSCGMARSSSPAG